jgi:DNA-binding transcriptional ArsR family regulator
MGGRLWTPFQEARLRRLYGVLPDEDLAARLCRTVHSVCRKALELGLRRMRAFNFYTWTVREKHRLRHLFGQMPAAEVARLLGKSVDAVRCQAHTMGLPPRPCGYTAEAEGIVRQLYGKVPLSEIARRVGRTESSVSEFAIHKLGLPRLIAHAQDFFANGGTLERLRELHQEGQTDKEIARAFGVTPGVISRHRRSLGLPAHGPYCPRSRQKIAAATRARMAQSPSEWACNRMRANNRDYAERSGWPPDLPSSATQVLNVLAGAGVPLSMRQIASILGRGPAVVHQRLRLLRGRGLVIRIPCGLVEQTGQGKAQHVGVYTLGPLALSILKERAQCKSNDETPR